MFGSLPGSSGGRIRFDLGQHRGSHLGERRRSKALNQTAAKPIHLSQGFDADHRDIELLKLRNFTVGKKIPDSVFTADDSQDQIADIIRPMVGYVSGTCSGSM